MTNGIFLGGFAQGQQRADQQATRDATLGLRQQQFDRTQQNDLETQRQKAIANTAQIALDTAEAARGAGKTVPPEFVENFRQELLSLGASQSIVDGLVQRMQLPPEPKADPIEEARIKGQAAAAQKIAEQEALGQPVIDAADLTKGEVAVDKKFATELVDFNARGGFADVAKGLDQLRSAESVLSGKDDDISGPLVGFVENIAELSGTSFFQKARAVREGIAEVVQRNLKLILGAQFSEREGKQLIDRAFNPALQEEENLKRVQRLIEAIEAAAVQKRLAIEHFSTHGTLKGFKGNLPTVTDLKRAIDEPPAQSIATPRPIIDINGNPVQ